MHNDTIFALATAPGKSGVAVIRISGPHALPALRALTGRSDVAPRAALYTDFGGIDRGIALAFPAPHSFTGEDVVELQMHGSLAVIRELLAWLGAQEGLRHAEPGEFSRRAFINGKMDLMEAEGLADLIAAETGRQRAQALNQMQGGLSRYYDGLRTGIIHCLAQLEAYIDFPDEDIPDSVLAGLAQSLDTLMALIRKALADGQRGERLRSGIRIAILGAPNAGKSSLLNALSHRDAAIVSTKAGTTRDVIETHLDIAGYPVILADTAGIRESSDEIEEEGIRRALMQADEADIKLVLFDAMQPMDAASRALVDERAMAVMTKCDLSLSPSPACGGGLGRGETLRISTQTGQGLDALLAALERRIVASFSGEAPFITQSRHRALLCEALAHLERYDPAAPLELACEELRRAGHAVAKITGKIAVDDVLDVVFKQFCIGK